MVKRLTNVVTEAPKSRAGNPILRPLLMVAAAAAIAAGVAGGCKGNLVDYAPIVRSYSLSPTTGVPPFDSNLLYQCEDPEGAPLQYSAFIDSPNGVPGVKDDSDIILIPPQPEPIRASYTFTDSGDLPPGDLPIYAEAVDPAGNSAVTKLGEVKRLPYEPPIDPPIDPPVNDNVDVSGGKLQDFERNAPEQGFVQFFDDYDNSTDTTGSPIKILDARDGAVRIDDYTVQTTSTGDFAVTLDKLVNANDSVYLRARLGTTATPVSYPRTIAMPAVDEDNLSESSNPRANPAVRALLYDNPSVSYDDTMLSTDESRTNFREQTGRENVWSTTERFTNGLEIEGVTGNPAHGLKKPGVQGIVISPEFANAAEIQSAYLSASSDYEHLGAIPVTVSTEHLGEAGYGSILPSAAPKVGGAGTSLRDNNSDGHVETFTAYLNSTSPDIGLAVHEGWYHGILASPGHADNDTTPALFDSVGKYTSYDTRYSPAQRSETPTPFNRKLASVIEDETAPGMESLYSLLGKD